MIRDTKGTRVVLGVLLAASFAAVSIDSHAADSDSPLRPVRATAAAVLGPLESGVAAVTRPLTGTVGAVSQSRSQAGRLADLGEENRRLRAEVLALRNAKAFAGAVPEVAALAASAGQQIVPGRVIALAANRGYSWTVTLDIGRRDGVRPDMTVLDSAGLVGRVVSATAGTATVLLLADPMSSIGVRLAGTGEIGTLDGAGEALPRLTLFDRHATLSPGDEVVTFGSPGSRPFVSGVSIGQVVEVAPRPGGLGAVATVRPHARLSALDVVGVVVALADGRDLQPRKAVQGRLAADELAEGGPADGKREWLQDLAAKQETHLAEHYRDAPTDSASQTPARAAGSVRGPEKIADRASLPRKAEGGATVGTGERAAPEAPNAGAGLAPAAVAPGREPGQAAADQKPTDEKPTDQKPTDQAAANQKPTDQKAADQKLAAQKADQKAADQKAADQKLAEQKPAEPSGVQSEGRLPRAPQERP